MPIKPLATPGPFINTPEIKAATLTCVNTTANLDIRPPIGQLWSVELAKVSATVFSSPDLGSRLRLRIMVTPDKGSNFYEVSGAQITQGSTLTAGGIVCSIGGSGSAFIISNDKYIRLSGDSNSTAGTQNADAIAFVKVL